MGNANTRTRTPHIVGDLEPRGLKWGLRQGPPLTLQETE